MRNKRGDIAVIIADRINKDRGKLGKITNIEGLTIGVELADGKKINFTYQNKDNPLIFFYRHYDNEGIRFDGIKTDGIGRGPSGLIQTYREKFGGTYYEFIDDYLILFSERPEMLV